MKKRQGSVFGTLAAVLALILLAASAYLGVAAVAARKTARGELALLDKAYSNSLAEFKEAEKYNKYILRKDLRVTEGMAESYYGLGQYASALEYYKLAVKNDPKNVKAIYRIGLIHISEKNHEKTEEQISALHAIGTREAMGYATELEEAMRENAVKGVFKDLYDRLAPNLPKIPGLENFPGLDRPKEKQEPGSGGREDMSVPPDAEAEKEPDQSDREGYGSTGVGATI